MTISRQRAWQMKQVAAGRCSQCGKEAVSSRKCMECLEKNKVAARLCRDGQPWRPGGRGRPPLTSFLEP